MHTKDVAGQILDPWAKAEWRHALVCPRGPTPQMQARKEGKRNRFGCAYCGLTYFSSRSVVPAAKQRLRDEMTPLTAISEAETQECHPSSKAALPARSGQASVV